VPLGSAEVALPLFVCLFFQRITSPGRNRRCVLRPRMLGAATCRLTFLAVLIFNHCVGLLAC
jgi:hypothetical protein